MKKINCSLCGAEMTYMKNTDIQLGVTNYLTGSLGNAIAGSLGVVVYVCPMCNKLEFFIEDMKDVPLQEYDDDYEDAIAKVVCKNCGASYDMDCPKCPECDCQNEN